MIYDSIIICIIQQMNEMDVEQSDKIFFQNNVIFNYCKKTDLEKFGITVGDEIDELISNTFNNFMTLMNN